MLIYDRPIKIPLITTVTTAVTACTMSLSACCLILIT